MDEFFIDGAYDRTKSGAKSAIQEYERTDRVFMSHDYLREWFIS